MQVTGLDHVQLAMPAGGEAQARAFYRDLLDLQEMPKPAPLAVRGGCWFEGAGVQVHLGVEADFRPAFKAHPAFLVSDLAALQRKLESAGMEIVLDNSLPDVQRFYAYDPFGNRIEFIQHGQGFSQK